MQKNKVQYLKKRILEECQKAKRDGWYIVGSQFVNPKNKYCCALGSFTRNGGDLHVVTKSIGMSDSDVAAFIAGFDDVKIKGYRELNPVAFDLGRSIGVEVLV